MPYTFFVCFVLIILNSFLFFFFPKRTSFLIEGDKDVSCVDILTLYLAYFLFIFFSNLLHDLRTSAHHVHYHHCPFPNLTRVRTTYISFFFDNDDEDFFFNARTTTTSLMMFPPLEPYFCGLSRNTCSSPTGR